MLIFGYNKCEKPGSFLGFKCSVIVLLIFLKSHSFRLFELREKTDITVSAASKYFANVMYGYRGYGLSIVSLLAHLGIHGRHEQASTPKSGCILVFKRPKNQYTF